MTIKIERAEKQDFRKDYFCQILKLHEDRFDQFRDIFVKKNPKKMSSILLETFHCSYPIHLLTEALLKQLYQNYNCEFNLYNFADFSVNPILIKF